MIGGISKVFKDEYDQDVDSFCSIILLSPFKILSNFFHKPIFHQKSSKVIHIYIVIKITHQWYNNSIDDS